MPNLELRGGSVACRSRLQNRWAYFFNKHALKAIWDALSVQRRLGRRDGTAGFVPHDYHQRHPKRFDSVFEAAQHREVDDFPRRADHKHIPQALIEDHFYWHTRVRTREHSGDRVLPHGEFVPAANILVWAFLLKQHESPVACLQLLPHAVRGLITVHLIGSHSVILHPQKGLGAITGGTLLLMIDDLLAWYDKHARDIVWRRGTTPWGVLLSEVMSQQTQVSRVAPLWEDWMQRWPTALHFSQASPDEILRAWGNLGYPRRALRLLDCARAIVEKHSGQVPDTVEELLELPGIGQYTARAIAAFAYRRRVPVVDTNVRRVLRRYVQGEFFQGNPRAADLPAVAALLPPERAPEFSVALMELGAIVCTPEPKCEQCPIIRTCAWRLAGCPKPTEPPKRRTQRFAGTDRQVRGIIMAHLREQPESERADIDILWPDATQRDRALYSLLADGLAEEHAPGKFRLPVA